MPISSRGSVGLFVGLGAAALLAACADGTSRVAEPSLSPSAKPSLSGAAQPRGCTGATGNECVGFVVPDEKPTLEQLRVCKHFDSFLPGRTTDSVQVHIEVQPGDPPLGPTDFVAWVHDGECRVFWANGELGPQKPDLVRVTEIVPAGYDLVSSYTGTWTRIGPRIPNPPANIVINAPTTANTSPWFPIGGPQDPGALVVYRNRPTPTGAIGDFVWNDLNANGIQDAGEPGISGVTVTLKQGSTTVATTTTDATGHYAFTGLPAGNYTVEVGTPSGYLVSPSNQGSDDTIDSDGSGVAVTVVGGVTDNTIDFGFYKLGSLGDFVWNDLNKNGIQDAGEPGIPGVTVTLKQGTTTIGTTTTDANGKYNFPNLAAGTYTVFVSGTPIGYVASPSNVGSNDDVDSDGSGASATVAGAPNNSVDFGFYEAIGTTLCTYTQGFWKNHESDWPVPFSANAPWMTPQRQVTGLTWDGLFGTPPKGGNSYVQLAHQWMAAKLNRANGAPTSASVLQALNAAEAWLLANTPVNGPLPSIKNAQADAWGTTLDNFNNGLAGTPHCN